MLRCCPMLSFVHVVFEVCSKQRCLTIWKVLATGIMTPRAYEIEEWGELAMQLATCSCHTSTFKPAYCAQSHTHAQTQGDSSPQYKLLQHAVQLASMATISCKSLCQWALQSTYSLSFPLLLDICLAESLLAQGALARHLVRTCLLTNSTFTQTMLWRLLSLCSFTHRVVCALSFTLSLHY